MDAAMELVRVVRSIEGQDLAFTLPSPMSHRKKTPRGGMPLGASEEQTAGNELSNEAVGLTVSAGIAPVGKIAGKAGGKVVSAAGKGTKSAASAVMSVAQANAFRKEARKLLINAGKLGDGEVAHHLVALRDERATAARRALEQYGISLNDPANLIRLPEGYHAQMHRGNYNEDLDDKLRKADSIERVRQILGGLASKYSEAAKGGCP